MFKKPWFTWLLLVVVAMLWARQWRATARLQERLREATVAREQWAREKAALLQEVADLRQNLAQDRTVIGQLWQIVQGGKPADGAEGDQVAAPSYDEAAVRKLLAAKGGSLEEVLHAILTPERLQAIQNQHLEEPAYWAAVASLLEDPEKVQAHLEQAAARFPQSPMIRALLIDQQIARGLEPESILTSIQTLRDLDPNNALADDYEAYVRFQRGDLEGAIQALAAASEKDRFADHRLDLLMSRYHCLLESGCSDGMAIGLSSLTLPFSHLGLFREVEQDAVQQAQALLTGGKPEQALQVAEYLLRVGRNLSASGRFLVYDRVGIGLQQAALEAKRQVFDLQGNQFQLQEINFQLGGVSERSAQISEMANRFGAILANMSEADLVNYIDGTILNGEFTTLQKLTRPALEVP